MDPLAPKPVSPASAAPLTNDQQKQLAKLHEAAQQMESLFVDMLFKEMRKGAPATSLTGKTSNAEQTFGEMLDTKRAEELSKSGSLGIGAILEQQLRAAVVGPTNVEPSAPPAPPVKETKQ
jgi:Rod binding domain-containing protein